MNKYKKKKKRKKKKKKKKRFKRFKKLLDSKIRFLNTMVYLFYSIFIK